MHAQEPPVLAGAGAIQRRVVLDRLAHAGDDLADDAVDPLADRALPAGHGGDIGLDRRLAEPLGNLRVAAREQPGAAIRGPSGRRSGPFRS